MEGEMKRWISTKYPNPSHPTTLVRAAKFIARKNYVITGSDDMQLRVFNYNTHEKVHSWDAHSDYIRCIAVHPTLPYVLSGSDDMTIRLWDWDKNWKCMQVNRQQDTCCHSTRWK